MEIFGPASVECAGGVLTGTTVKLTVWLTALPLSRLTDRFQRARLVQAASIPSETSRAHFGLYFSYVRGTDWCDLAFVLPGNPHPGSFFHSRMGHKLSCNSPCLS